MLYVFILWAMVVLSVVAYGERMPQWLLFCIFGLAVMSCVYIFGVVYPAIL